MEIIYILASLILGFLVAFFIFNTKTKAAISEKIVVEAQLKNISEHLNIRVLESSDLTKKNEYLQQRILEKENSFEQKIKDLDDRLLEKDKLLVDVNKEKNLNENTSIKTVSELGGENKSLRMLLEERNAVIKNQEEKFLKIEENFKNEFKNMAQEILEEKSKKFSEIGKKDISELIEPLKEKINNFSKQVRESYENESKERFNLKEEIKHLNEMNIKLSDDANNLTIALKGESKTQGDWGEMILDNILSESGLSLGREYVKQETVRDEDGNALRPDFVVKYPDERFIIIDSKVSLRAYESYSSAENMIDKKRFLEAHLSAVKDRIKELSSKNYQDNFPGSPDFVMMFMPIEPAYILAIQSDASLWNNAFEKRVVLMSPTNLIAALKMISELWKHDDQNKNSQLIADSAAALYDKFVGFYEDLDIISKSMNKINENFENAKNKLSTGKGNLVSRVEKLRKLGVKPKKKLDTSFQSSLEIAENNEESEYEEL
ncbi:MAG: hypothetical protein AUJ98_07055 [Bacteroidetes bacterium CG2_30_33_31]|nr:MAG: hypothetical protein AUJ98_07055 [Bacteroidetes bacterium CG2_30_33_31]